MIQNVQAGKNAAEFLALGNDKLVDRAGFADLLAAAARQEGPVRAGRLGVEMMPDGRRIARVTYHAESGELITNSAFNPVSLLENARRLGIDREDFRALGEALDAAGIGYRPYELYPGTGSNHGIDLADLADGGLGTVYDWTEDRNAHLKGPTAMASLQHARTVAEACGVRKPETVAAPGATATEPRAALTLAELANGSLNLPATASVAATASPAAAPTETGTEVSPASTATELAAQIETLLDKVLSQAGASALDLLARRVAERLSRQ
jgi:hypothetical protein